MIEAIEAKIDVIKYNIIELIINKSSNNVFDTIAEINVLFDDVLDMVRSMEEDRRWCTSRYLEKELNATKEAKE